MCARTLVIGFGVTGAGAARHLLDNGADPTGLVVVDSNAGAAGRAAELGLRTIVGDGTDRHVLARATSGSATRHVVVAVVPDEAAVFATMLARDLCPTAVIVAAVRDDAHIAVVCRHGADYAVSTSEATGTALVRALSGQEQERTAEGTAVYWTIDERPAEPSEVGRPPYDCAPNAVGVIRDSQRFWGPDAAHLRLAADDHLLFLQVRTAPGRTET
ncbi:TrkA family protein [Saccharothrix carnea]|uniref:TrkA family protein n=1 Tax=Saccharothrix carnea TaxID=1280637 RepID=A0A2P8I455_SACCR|nr:NAD(P)-binding protein [Saccharothrix carnea]PSL53224.1 TrkA family protein [Saccharothrix carnea]